MVHVRVGFGTTEEELRRKIAEVSQQSGWDLNRVHFVIDINACTVKETAYAVSDRTSDLPLHASGQDAVQKLVR